PLLLPQTEVTIHARELRFEGDGKIDTTPRPRTLKPATVLREENLNVGRNGFPGHSGTNINVFVERFFSDPTMPTRFIMRGGTGSPAGEGRHGVNENEVIYESPEWTRLMQRAGNPICDTEV